MTRRVGWFPATRLAIFCPMSTRLRRWDSNHPTAGPSPRPKTWSGAHATWSPGRREEFLEIERAAYDILRTFTSYVLGSALAEITWELGQAGCVPQVRDLLRPGTPDDLADVAEVFCGQSDPDSQFALGLDLMLCGLDDPRA